MTKNNKITVLLVAAVMVLTIYYINLDQSTIDVFNDEEEQVSVSSDLEQQRDQILLYRQQLVTNLLDDIHSIEVSITDKNNRLEEVDRIQNLTKTEISYETLLENNGYSETLVFINDNSITVTVGEIEPSLQEANKVINIINEVDTSNLEVIVTFIES